MTRLGESRVEDESARSRFTGRKGISRRKFLQLTAGVVASGLFGRAGAAVRRPAIGVVVPNQTGLSPVGASQFQVVGEAARMGAILAEEEAIRGGGGWSSDPEVLVASAPDDLSALRAAQRVLALDDAFALVGGFTVEQARSLAMLAEERGVLFLNIACASDSLRGYCGGNTFHIEATASMYLGGLLQWAGADMPRRWFFVHPATSEGLSRYRSATRAVESLTPHSRVVGRAALDPVEGGFERALERISDAEPDSVMVLSDALGQLDFLARYQASGFAADIFGFPDPTSQTRMFYEASRRTSVKPSWAIRAALWEATLEEHGAASLNQSFLSRWGRPMDPSAWAAFQAVAILSQLAASADSLNAAELAARLEAAESTFDLRKGVPVAFRKADHQLVQPLYAVGIEPDALGLLGLARVDSVLSAPPALEVDRRC